MVFQKRIYYGGFHGLLAPVIPKAPRSLRRRSLHNKSSENGEICAFELLADVAGKLLLQESESSTSSTNSEQKAHNNLPKEDVNHDEPLEVKVKPVISEHHDQESGVESEPVAQPTNLEPFLKEFPHSENDSHASIVTNSDFIQKVNTNLRMEDFEDKNRVNDTHNMNLYNVDFGDNRDEIKPEAIEKHNGGLTAVNTHKPSSNVHLSFYRDPIRSACFSRHRGNVKINIRDDDENYFRYDNRSTRRRPFGSRSRAGYRRMRKMLTSRYRKVTPKMKDYNLTNTTSGVRSFYHKRKNIYMRERCQADAASKRRKLFHHSSKTAYIKEASNESISNSTEKIVSGDNRRPPANLNRVKFSIKSFKVPELYFEVPETATVGSLKRSVMEAVTAILQGKLHVGVLLQGKKVRDDSRTLQQTGISQNCNLENLGFILEPSLPEETPLLHLSRSPSSPVIDGGLSDYSPDRPPTVISLDKHLEKNEDEVLKEEQVEDSKALVVVPSLDTEVLSMIPMSEKPRKIYELSQRRTRRPFSVSEVEALVEAVETLGAGRWRDVKMRAFDDANHRTYVDLKDKWKTLVHTASISPQQRRGEPVPQDLLDRVLAAHAYWSHHQSKQQHGKHQKPLGVTM